MYKVQAVAAGSLPDGDFVPPFMHREAEAKRQTAEREKEINAVCVERFGRVWRIRHGRNCYVRFWNRLMFLFGQ